MISDGRRLELFFQKNGIGHQYVKNLSVISERDDKLASQYKDWLLTTEVPKIKDRILEAIEGDFLEHRIDADCYKCRLELHKELFDMYENLIKNTSTEGEYLKAYS